jgi:hypothetical protein
MGRHYFSLGNLKAGGSMGTVILIVGLALAAWKPKEVIGIVGFVMAITVFLFWVISYVMYLDRKSRRK